MLNMNTFVFVGIAVFAVFAVAPVALPLLGNLLDSMQFMPDRY